MMHLRPCMPPDVELIDELVKLEEEHEELIDAIIEGDYEEVCKEALDVMQVVSNISCFNNIDGMRMKEYKHAQKIFELALEKIDRSNRMYRNELVWRLIDEHYQKMEQRKKQWESDKVEG